MKKKIGLGALILLVIIQFFQIDRTNPEFNKATEFFQHESADNKMASMIKNACYDCHSFETKYPWYTYINPFGLWVKGHVKEGTQNVNYSEWGLYDQKKRNFKLEEMAEVVEETRMPLTPYLLTHKEARITKEERKIMAAWFRNQIK